MHYVMADQLPMADHFMRGRPGAMSSDVLTNGQNMNLANQLPVDSMPRPGRETVPLPLDASSTLYVEGLPPDSTRREVAHIFRPFVGYKAVRLVSKESKHRGGILLFFVLWILKIQPVQQLLRVPCKPVGGSGNPKRLCGLGRADGSPGRADGSPGRADEYDYMDFTDVRPLNPNAST